MRKPYFYLLIFTLLFVAGCRTISEQQTAVVSVIIPNTIREMKSPGFWINNHTSPDKIILDAEGVRLFNARIEKELNLIINPLNEPLQYNGKRLKNDLAKDIDNFSDKNFYLSNGPAPDKNFYNLLRQNMDLPAINDKIEVRYGFLTHYANQRLLPTDEILTTKPGDFEFDELQNSSLDVGTPLIILHETKDGLWVYAETASSSGWFKKDKIIFCEPHEFKDLLVKEKFIVVTSGKADIFLDEDLNKYYDYARMGARFAYNATVSPKVFEIILPSKTQDGKFFLQKAYLQRQDANEGYLPYTAKNIIEEAFKLLNASYGWGGRDGEQDCSSYIQGIFQTAGITLPRNSSAQGKTGQTLGSFTASDTEEKLKILKQEAIPGVTILQLKGHVVLYLGMYNNNPYVIHETHGYVKKNGAEETTFIVNRVIVSDLSLGEGSKKGSLLSRIVNIRLVK